MILRRPLSLGLVIGFVSVFSFSGQVNAQEMASAQAPGALPVGKVEQMWPALDASQRSMVDLLAADFFQNDLSEAQRERIFAARADQYRGAAGADRDSYRAERRREWQARKGPAAPTGTSYDLLTDDQKAPFRRYAIDQLDLGLTTVSPGAAGRNSV
ncbi:hypothetical protein [Aquisalinus flavus]|uniref:Uncharacterized protein n=1 Tax=Aquisalinus flavus TaxID=1526572 RepID=A0A8J2V2J2_9PROT|nr:hypothetical protein [Aquisalinus flavus]MBD0427782.1 hypothetical protein [Aquisalinus flavus]UNE47556.1 hypothetical protein FF099_05535 [Aquisalinus flavus]GGD03796.1 hypothetical protein GCM10011342_10970 [Aquisalinus flavus]